MAARILRSYSESGSMLIFRPRLKVLFSMVVVHCACALYLQAQCNGDDLGQDDKYRVRLVKVDSLFGRVPNDLKAILAKHHNELYRTTADSLVIGAPGTGSETSLDTFKAEVRSFFGSHDTFKKDSAVGVNQHEGLYVRAAFSNTCVKIVPPLECEKTVTDEAGKPYSKCIDVTIRIRVIPVNTGSAASNLLDLARSNQPRFYRELPRPLLALNPNFGIEQDKAYGPSIVGKISTELLGLPSLLRGEPKTAQDTQLRLSISGRKSLKLPFYHADTRLALSRARPLKLFEKITAGLGYLADRQEKGEGELTRNSISAGAGALVRLKTGVVERLSIGTDYRRTTNNFRDQTGISRRTIEDILSLRILADGAFANGFFRGAVWFDRASPEKAAGPYRRAAAMFGFARNFVLPQKRCEVVTLDSTEVCRFPKQNPPVIGIEILGGFGLTRGHVPAYARYYGGNASGSFLYAAIDEQLMAQFPDGPLMRSFGRNKAGAQTAVPGTVTGGNSYQHINLSVSLPVKAWSKPLIPSIPISERGDGSTPLSCQTCSSLKDVLKNQVREGKNIYIDAIASRSLTDKERDDLALDPDADLTPDERARLARAEQVFEAARLRVVPEADSLWQQITPPIEYIADNANLYSVKPLLMFDAARISANGLPQSRTRLGIGGGLQLNVIVAKFELGYMRTVRRLPGDDKGNFIIRMVFEKLF